MRVPCSVVWCARQRGKLPGQWLADLPADHVEGNTPALHTTGIDVFAPYLVKHGKSQVKRYGCIFTCPSSRKIQMVWWLWFRWLLIPKPSLMLSLGLLQGELFHTCWDPTTEITMLQPRVQQVVQVVWQSRCQGDMLGERKSIGNSIHLLRHTLQDYGRES